MNLSFRQITHSIGKFFLGNSIPGAGFWNWIIPGEWTRTDLIKQYAGVVFTVVSAIAEEAAKIDFEVKRGDRPVLDHEFLKLIRRPNPDYSQFQFLELHFTFLKLMGESYWYVVRGKKSKKPKELYLLRPDLVQVVVDENSATGSVKGYVLIKPNGDKVPFDKDEILHFKMPNPSNPYYGLGPVQAAKIYIETEKYASEWTRNSIFNSGRPSGVLNMKGKIGEEEFKQLKRQFKEQYSGINNAGKTLITRGADGIDFQKIGMELQEIALKELKDMTRDDIMMMFRVSKTLLGISEGVTLNNARESRQMFRESIVMGEQDRMNDHLNAFLMPSWNDTDQLTYKTTTFKTIEQELAEDTQGHNKWLTTNDIRKRRGMKSLPGGDVIREPINLVPSLTNEPEKPAESQDNPQDNQPGDNSNNQDDPEGDPAEDAKKGVKKKELREQRAEIYKKQVFDIQIAWEKKYKSFMVGEFNTQEKEILAKNTKAAFGTWIFDVDASTQRIVGNLVPMGLELMEEAAQYALDIADDADRQFEITQAIKDYVQQRILKLADATNDETIQAIEAAIAEGISQGESVAKLKKRIREIYDNATNVRAERIARTESLAASNEGTLEAYKQSPLVTGKEWSAEANACQYCNSLNGKIIGLSEDFAKLGQGVEGDDGQKLKTDYENILHPPLHPNCRCALLPVAGN